MPYATDRPGFTGGGTSELAEWFTQQRLRNPGFRAPQGYEWKGDHYERDEHGFIDDLAKWTGRGAVAGSAVAGGLGMAGLGPAAGLGSAGSAVASGVPAGLPGAVPLGTMAGPAMGAGAGAAGGGIIGTIGKLAPLAGVGAAGLGMFGGGGQEQPYQDELQGLLGLQRGRMEQAAPLYQAILKMAMGLLPMSARSGLTGRE